MRAYVLSMLGLFLSVWTGAAGESIGEGPSAVRADDASHTADTTTLTADHY